MLPPESAPPEAVAREIGVGVDTLERWRSESLSRPNTVQIRSTRNAGVGSCLRWSSAPRCRTLKLLILRLTPRGL